LGDVLRDIDFTFSGTSTTTAPTGVGVYTITPSNADFQHGTLGNYRISYVGSILTILAKYIVTYDPNGGSLGMNISPTKEYVVGEEALVLPTAAREGFTFQGWFSSQNYGAQVTGPLTPTASATFWARWTQNSLIGIQGAVKIGTLTTVPGQGIIYSANSQQGTVSLTYIAGSLPAGTNIDIYQMSSAARAESLISSSNSYVLSLVVAWLTPTQTVPILSSQSPLTMVITDPVIKKGAKVYSLVGTSSALLGVATSDGSVSVSIFEDPEVYIAISVPDAPTSVVTGARTDSSAVISWQPPTSSGGADVTTYSALANSGQSCTTSSLSCTITGLTNGVSYTFTVTAINSQGSSPNSVASATYVPVASILSISPVIAPSRPLEIPPVAVVPVVPPSILPSEPPAIVIPKPPVINPVVVPPVAQPKPVNPKAIISQFAAGSFKINKFVRAQVLATVKRLKSTASQIECTGYASGPTALKGDAVLALKRAREVCNSIQKLLPGLKIVKISRAQDTRVGALYRRVEINIK
jgi:hypothetical protein